MTDPADLRRLIPADARLSRWTAPDGWEHRRFDWPSAAGRGRVLVQGGRADIIEKYYETIVHLHGQGWGVTAFDWRGQGGSGRLSANPRVGHADSFDAWVADLGAFWRDWTAEGDGPSVLIAHSMGAHLALRALAESMIDPDAVVLVAPMVGIRSPVGARAGTLLTRLMAAIGDPARAAWKVRADQRSAGHRQRLLTHSVERYDDEAFWYTRDPALLLGPPSWAWVREAFVASARLQADSRLGTVTVPILMLVSDEDGLVDSAAAVRLAQRLPNVELVRFGPEAAHEILREADDVRLRAYRLIDTFLDEHTGR